MPFRTSMSALLMPIASARTRTSPAAGCGSGFSASCSTSGPPPFCISITFMWRIMARQEEVQMAARIRSAAAVAALLIAAPGLVAAQQYPSKPLRIIIPFPPGAATDITGRYVAYKLGESLGQQAIADNRPGANGTIGLELAAKAPPDGHTLVIGQTGNLAISPGLTKVAYDPARDFPPISLLIASPNALAVHPSLPARNLKELVALARSRPGQLNYASTGSGSGGHLGMELLKKSTVTDIVHVPYKGGTPGLTDLAAGYVAMMFTSAL